MKRSLTLSLVGIIVAAAAILGGTQAAGWSPHLGLDLQGGASVVLKPRTSVPSGVLNQSIAIIRTRVDALGVGESQIDRQGSNIVVQLPGVKDQARALAVVGQTAELRFRPVLQTLPPQGDPPTTAREADLPDQTVVLPELDKNNQVTSRYQLGPAEITGRVVRNAVATPPQVAGDWTVDVTFTNDGSSKFDAMAGKYVGKQVAIVLDSVVKSAPTIQQAQFNGKAQITGSFGEKEAKDLALVLRYGSLPVQLEPQSVERVSATLGKDSLRAGIIAGIVGLALVLLYMILYYRALGLVVLLGLSVSGALLWGIISYLGHANGLALSLAGATGIIVSVGVTVDSYIVYFERLKDEIRSGKTVRSSVDRGFSRAYRTILAADLVSFIAAASLYLLTVGAVRGFAFFLGLSTVLDVITAYLFTRPMVILLGRNRTFTQARWLGVARGLAAEPAGGPA
jgi:preprotein translocase subunit SecD